MYWIGANRFEVRRENERFIVNGLRCCQNLKFENFTELSFGRLRRSNALKWMPQVQLDHLSSSNRSYHALRRFCCRCHRRCLNSSLVMLSVASCLGKRHELPSSEPLKTLRSDDGSV